MVETTAPEQPLPGNELRERRRLRMAATIERTALELFAERGFANVTVNDIAAAVDISRRTFFRYFASKESVLFGDPQRDEDRLVEILERRSATDPVQAFHAALIEAASDLESDPAVTELRLRVLESAPSITSAGFAQRIGFQQRLTPIVARIMDVDPTLDMRPDVIVSVSMSAMYVGMTHWLANGARESLLELVTEALDQTADGLTATATRRVHARAVRSH
jgi:TetR/AcrR family transcriptional regulator, regulator of mycofactocin system